MPLPRLSLSGKNRNGLVNTKDSLRGDLASGAGHLLSVAVEGEHPALPDPGDYDL